MKLSAKLSTFVKKLVIVFPVLASAVTLLASDEILETLRRFSSPPT